MYPPSSSLLVSFRVQLCSWPRFHATRAHLILRWTLSSAGAEKNSTGLEGWNDESLGNKKRNHALEALRSMMIEALSITPEFYPYLSGPTTSAVDTHRRKS
jgi:hypothetical protein